MVPLLSGQVRDGGRSYPHDIQGIDRGLTDSWCGWPLGGGGGVGAAGRYRSHDDMSESVAVQVLAVAAIALTIT